MGWFDFLNPALDALFGPLLQLQAPFPIIILAFVATLIITLIYKYTTDQDLMKQLKDELKELQKEMKLLRDQPQKAMEVQKQAMQTNMKYMMQSMKATLFTFLPIILLIGWMQGHFALEPIQPYQEFTVEAVFGEDGNNISLSVPDDLELLSEKSPVVKAGVASWALSGPPGDYVLQFDYQEKTHTLPIKISQIEYLPAAKTIDEGGLQMIRTSQQKRIILNLFGWKLGWLGTYIIFSIFFSIILRKAMKVY